MTIFFDKNLKPSRRKCKHPFWLYLTTLRNTPKQTVYMLYCPVCMAKTGHICDYSEKQSLKLFLGGYNGVYNILKGGSLE